MNDVFLTRKQVASMLGICLNTLDFSLQIPKIKLGKRVLYRQSDIENYISTHTIKPTFERG